MATILDKIAAYKRDEVAAAKAAMPFSSLDLHARSQPKPRSCRRSEPKHEAGYWALIAEIRKASPSKGLIRADFDPPSSPKPMNWWCRLSLRIDGYAQFSRRAAVSDGGTESLRATGAA